MPSPDANARPAILLIGNSNCVGAVSTGFAQTLQSQTQRWIWWKGSNARRPGSSQGWEQYTMASNSNWWNGFSNGGCEAACLERMQQRWGYWPHVFKMGVWQSSLHAVSFATSWLKASSQLYSVLTADWAAASSQAVASWPGKDLGIKTVGIILGMADALDSAAGTAFAANMQQLLTDLDADVGGWAADTPAEYAVVRIPSWYRDAVGTAAANAVYDGAQTAVTAFGARAHLVDTDGFSNIGDKTHYDVAGLNALGVAIANARP